MLVTDGIGRERADARRQGRDGGGVDPVGRGEHERRDTGAPGDQFGSGERAALVVEAGGKARGERRLGGFGQRAGDENLVWHGQAFREGGGHDAILAASHPAS